MEELEKKARMWLDLKANDTGFQIKFKERQDNALIFQVLRADDETESDVMQFTVHCPSLSADDWVVAGSWSFWSDSAGFKDDVQEIIDYCDSTKATSVEDILQKVTEVCEKLFLEEDEDEDEDEEEDYDVEGEEDLMYYNTEENFMEETERAVAEMKHSESDEDIEETFFGSGASPVACKRLVKDLKNMKKEAHKFGLEGDPRGNNLFIWDVKLTGFPTDSGLGKDLQAWATKHSREPVVYLEMQFPGDYPMAPPFVRVIRPRFKFLTGHVTIGGSICMEMLTRSGWSPSNDIESILVQIRAEIMSDQNARLDSNPDREYGEAEAKDAFKRMVERYGW
ncbi:ubiquitin-conjugating enzyme E2 Q2-like isoform X1 [Dreissena polymorpha]|nr:ubiquitin-conjugating enzyme E2 Q2-like isoform X1 [Dreissena polymorpha]